MNRGSTSFIDQQRKIFENCSRSLNIDNAKIINFPITRMDILFWDSIIDLGEKIEHIGKSTELV